VADCWMAVNGANGDGRRLRFGASASLIGEPPIGEFPNGL
jgi:hypothetical protein